MPHESFRTTISLSRRTALGGVGAAATVLGLGHLMRASAQEATPRGTPDAIEQETDVAYGEADGQELLLDISRPPGRDTPRPAVVLFHGGARGVTTCIASA